MDYNKTLILKVNGIHCNGCESKIKKSLAELTASQQTEVDIKTGEVRVQFNAGELNLSDIKAKIIAVGFQIESFKLE